MDYFTGGGWEGHVVNVCMSESIVYVVYSVSIHAAEGLFRREATVSEQLDNNGWGEAIAKAESQAFRRACARWGLALYLYEQTCLHRLHLFTSLWHTASPVLSPKSQS